MGDITGNLNITPSAKRNWSLIEERCVVLDLIKEGITTATTYNIMDLAVGEACIGGFIAVETTVTGASVTIQVKIGSDALSGAVPIAALQAGDVRTFGNHDIGSITTHVGYAKSAADTIDLLTAAGTITAGVFVFCAYIVNVKAIIDANIT